MAKERHREKERQKGRNTQPPFNPSVGSLCHFCVTPTRLSYRFSIFETSATALCGTTGIPMYVYAYHETQVSYTLTLAGPALCPPWPRNCWFLPNNCMSFSGNGDDWEIAGYKAWFHFAIHCLTILPLSSQLDCNQLDSCLWHTFRSQCKDLGTVPTGHVCVLGQLQIS